MQFRPAAGSADRRRAGRGKITGSGPLPDAAAARDRRADLSAEGLWRGGGERRGAAAGERRELGSIIVVVATDAPLLPHQLKRIATRASLGVGRQGGFGGNGSGDIFVAFSTANAKAWSAPEAAGVQMLSNDRLDPLFRATVLATEAAITNALLAAETMVGANGIRVHELPVAKMQDVMRRHGRAPAGPAAP